MSLTLYRTPTILASLCRRLQACRPEPKAKADVTYSNCGHQVDALTACQVNSVAAISQEISNACTNVR